jgi:hypothetical protein
LRIKLHHLANQPTYRVGGTSLGFGIELIKSISQRSKVVID